MQVLYQAGKKMDNREGASKFFLTKTIFLVVVPVWEQSTEQDIPGYKVSDLTEFYFKDSKVKMLRLLTCNPTLRLISCIGRADCGKFL